MPIQLPMIKPASGASSCGKTPGMTPDAQLQETRLRALDEEFERITQAMDAPQAAARVAEHATPPPPVEGARLSSKEPLPLVAERSHRVVEGRHLWVGVHEAALMVLSDEDNAVFERLDRGDTVEDVTAFVMGASAAGHDEAWTRVSRVISRAATAGFVKGLRGHTAYNAPKPNKFARFHVTQACQLECVHCYADSGPDVDRHRELPPERWRTLIGDFAAQGGQKVLFTGGEALVYKGCLDLLAFARECGLEVTLFSNGILVPRFINGIAKGATQVQISIDGPDAASNDAIRGLGSYAGAVRAIDALLDAGVKTSISTSVMNENWAAWKEGFTAFAGRYAGRVELKVTYGVMQYGRGTRLQEVEVEDTRATADGYMKRFNGELGSRVTTIKAGCGYGEQLVVGPDGYVYPCHLLDAKLGHIDDAPLPQIIARLMGVSEVFDVDHIEGCNTCDIRYLCGGKCRVIEGRKIGTRMVTTCTPLEKEFKLRNLVRSYGSA